MTVALYLADLHLSPCRGGLANRATIGALIGQGIAQQSKAFHHNTLDVISTVNGALGADKESSNLLDRKNVGTCAGVHTEVFKFALVLIREKADDASRRRSSLHMPPIDPPDFVTTVTDMGTV